MRVLRRRLPRAEAGVTGARAEGPFRVPPLSAGRSAPPRPPRCRGRGGGRGAGQVLADARSLVSAAGGARRRGPGGVRARARARCRPGAARAGRPHARRAGARGLSERGAQRRERHAAILHQWPPARGAGGRQNARRRAAAGPVDQRGFREPAQRGQISLNSFSIAAHDSRSAAASYASWDMPYFAASGLVKPCFAPGYVITSNRAPAACISRLNASTCSGGTNGSAPPASTRTRALTLRDCAGEVVASAPWNVTTAARSAPVRAMPSTTAPPKQYAIAAMRVVSTWGSRFSCSSAALNRAASTAGSLVASLANACASCGWVVTLPLPYMSSANPTYPASARRRAWLRACSLCPHHSCTTSTVSPWRYSISRVFTVALPGDRVSKTAVIANPYRACMPRPPGAWFIGL